MNNGIAGQARWIPAEQSIAPACLKAILIAVAVLAVVKQVQDIKDGQKKLLVSWSVIRNLSFLQTVICL